MGYFPGDVQIFELFIQLCANDKSVPSRGLPFYAAERGPHVRSLRRVLLSYAMYNFNLRYCQVKWQQHLSLNRIGVVAYYLCYSTPRV